MPDNEMEVNVPVGGEGAREGDLGGRGIGEAIDQQMWIRAQELAARLDAQGNELLVGNPWVIVRNDEERIRRPIAVNPFPRKEKKQGVRGEELFKLILSGIKEVYGVDAVIAGGAVRDVAAGTDQHKDVDVFIPMKWKDFNEHASQLGWEGPPFKEGKIPYDGKLKRLPATERGQASVQGCLVDLVFMNGDLSPKYVNTFPVNAQKCVFTLENGISVSPVAQADIDAKQFTIDPEIKDKDQIKIIRDKVNGWKRRAFYKEWKVVEPDVKEWWEE